MHPIDKLVQLSQDQMAEYSPNRNGKIIDLLTSLGAYDPGEKNLYVLICMYYSSITHNLHYGCSVQENVNKLNRCADKLVEKLCMM